MNGPMRAFVKGLTESPKLYFAVPRTKESAVEHKAETESEDAGIARASSRLFLLIAELCDVLSTSAEFVIAEEKDTVSYALYLIHECIEPTVRDNALLLRMEVLLNQSMRGLSSFDERARTASFASGYFRALADTHANVAEIFQVYPVDFDRLEQMLPHVIRKLRDWSRATDSSDNVLSDTA
jgi:hypothetical protein